jgi:hypothetical protein
MTMKKVIATLIAGLFATAAFAQTTVNPATQATPVVEVTQATPATPATPEVEATQVNPATPPTASVPEDQATEPVRAEMKVEPDAAKAVTAEGDTDAAKQGTDAKAEPKHTKSTAHKKPAKDARAAKGSTNAVKPESTASAAITK